MTKTDLRQFDYEEVANLDSAMWRAYYNHQFLKLFSLALRLIKTQLGLNWILTIRLAYYSAWAAAYYRINKHKGVDNTRVLNSLTKFFRIISENSVEVFDYQKAAELELAWWDVHRRSKQNNEALEQSLAVAAAAVYNVPSSALGEYAHCRAAAMILPQHEGDKQPVFTNWAEVTALLNESWRSLHKVIQKEE
jgi:hypothetical protein